MLLRTLPILFLASAMFAQSPVAIAPGSDLPPIEAGVSQELAKWRASHYSDVRYKLNLTLEKMSPVLKGTIEIRVKVGEKGSGGVGESEPGAVATGLITPIILDWRKIKGHEEKSTIANVTINDRKLLPRPIVLHVGPPRFYYDEKQEHLIFYDGVVAGENVIKLDFTSPILTSGSAITRYVDKEDGAEYIYSLFVPSDASTTFPVFDQPDLKARFELNLIVPIDWKAVSNNTPKVDLDDWIEVHHGVKGQEGFITLAYNTYFFPQSKPISTYVFAFAAGPFERVSGGVSSPTVKEGSTPRPGEPFLTVGLQTPSTNIYVRKSQAEKFKPHAAEVFRLNREAVKYFEEYFDYKFPFPKYDLVLIPEFPFGGMEHAGATFLRESAIIFPQEPTKNDHISRAVLIFHEAAHQWFGDTVTMRWFDDLWLKEGFANFAAYKAMEKIMPEANAWKVFYERVKQAAYRTDSTKGTTPIYQEIKNLSAAKSAYGNIVYNKAPAFLRQAEFYLGEDKFQTAVRAFLKKHSFSNAGWEDLVREFEVANGKETFDTSSLSENQKYVVKAYEQANGTDLTSWAERWVTRPQVYRIKIGKKWPNDRQQLYSYFYEKNNEGENVCRPMKFRLFVRFEKGKSKTTDVRTACDPLLYDPKKFYLEAVKGITLDPKKKFGEPLLIFPNYQDYGYGIFLLDDKSRDYVLKNIQNEKDSFLRAMMWGSLWDSVREGELDPREYVELVVKNLGVESDESTIATLLGRTSTALNYYIEPTGRNTSVNERVPVADIKDPRSLTVASLPVRVENMLIERMQNAETLGQRITYYRAFLNIAASENARSVLKKMLSVRPSTTPSAEAASTPPNQGGEFKSVPLRTKDKFDIVTKLLILGDADAPKMLADLEKTETSDEAKRYAYAAKAGIVTAENKSKYWNDFVNNKEISESWIEAAFGPFNSIRHSELTLPYLQKALQELPNHKRSRKIFFVNGWLGAFIGGQRSEEALAIVNKFLADNPNLDKDLRLKILENVDVIERAVKIRAKHSEK